MPTRQFLYFSDFTKRLKLLIVVTWVWHRNGSRPTVVVMGQLLHKTFESALATLAYTAGNTQLHLAYSQRNERNARTLRTF